MTWVENAAALASEVKTSNMLYLFRTFPEFGLTGTSSVKVIYDPQMVDGLKTL